MPVPISLVITTYNRDRYLGAAIESILTQTRHDFELIVWDDGSTDKSVEIAREYAKCDRRVRVIAAEHQGRIPSLKDAIAHTKGTYIGFVDSDDLLAPTALLETAAVLEANPEVGLVYTDYLDINPKGKLISYGKRCQIPYSKERLLLDFMTFHFRLMRRDVLEQVGGFDESMAYVEDYDLCLKLSEITEVRHVKKPLYYYRCHPGSDSQQYTKQQAKNSARAIANAIHRREMSDRFAIQLQILRHFPFQSIVKLIPKNKSFIDFFPIPPQVETCGYANEACRPRLKLIQAASAAFVRVAAPFRVTAKKVGVPLLSLAFCLSPTFTKAQITPGNDTNTNVTTTGNQIDIKGGKLSADKANLFHSFSQFGLDSNQIANFLSKPSIQNIFGRVNGGNPSIINGLLQVTGGNSNIFLMNPAGIVFGNNASLNVPASLTATTATSIGFGNNNSFNAYGLNNYANLTGIPNTFTFSTQQPGSIVNTGNLAVETGYNLILLGGTVLNTGTLTAPGGNITVAAVPGESSVRISNAGNVLSLEVSPLVGQTSVLSDVPGQSPQSLPQLLTGGNVVNATGLIVNSDRIQITGSGISVPVESGNALASGKLDASNTQPGATGGAVAVLGNKVALVGANVNVSGDAGGGRVLIGGDYLGKGSVPNAAYTYVGEDAKINADAITNGNGGRVIVWADEATRTHGNITARGGSEGGNGGFIETSGKNYLEVTKPADASSPKGLPGTWLLDPRNVIIQASPTTNGAFSGGNPDIFTPTNDDAIVDVATIISSLGYGTDVTITTGNTGTQAGDITLASGANIFGGSGTTLTLEAANNIILNGSINVSGPAAAINVVLRGAGGAGVPANNITTTGSINTGGGSFQSNSINFTINGSINTGGGSFQSSSVNFNSQVGTIITNGADIDINATNSINVGTLITNSNFGSGNINLVIGSASTSAIIINSDLDAIGGDFGNGGDININGNVVLRNNATFTTTTPGTGYGYTDGDINITGRLDGNGAGGQNLTLETGQGNITFGNAVGDTTPIGNLTVNSNDVTLNGNVKTAPGSSINFNSGLTLNSGNDIALIADEIDFRGTVVDATSTGTLILAPATANRNIQVGGAYNLPGSLTVTASDLNVFTSTRPLVIGGTNSNGTITIDPGGALFSTNVTIQTQGAIAVNGTITNPNGFVNLIAPTTTLNADISSISIDGNGNNSISIDGNVLLGNNVALSASRGGGAPISITGTVDGTGAGGQSLTLSLSSPITFGGAIGDTTPIGNLTIVDSGTTNLNGNITTTSGSTISFDSNIILNSDVTLTADEIDFRPVPTISGTGNLTLQPATASRNIEIGGAYNNSNALSVTAGDMVVLSSFRNALTIGGATSSGKITLADDTSFLSQVTLQAGSIDTAGFEILGSGRAIALLANQNITTGDITNPAGNITLTSSNGTIDTTAGTIDSSFSSGDGGAIAFTANGNILAGDIISSSTNGSGGIISLTSQTVAVESRDLTATGTTKGGDITISATTRITAGQINSSASTGNGGNVILDPENDISVGFINAQGGDRGTGGIVDITTGRFFRATDTFTDTNGQQASISNAGGLGGNAITIRHGGNNITPFIVGDAGTNGTRGVITTGSDNSIIPTQSFLDSYSQGTAPSEIKIITASPPPSPPPTQPLQPDQQPSTAPNSVPDEATPPEENESPQLSLFTTIPPAEVDTLLVDLDESFTRSFEQYIGESADTPVKTLTEARDILLSIETATGIKPALIYINFVPATATPKAADKTISLPISPESDVIWQFNAQGLALNQVSQQQVATPPANRPAQNNDQLELVVVTAKGSAIRKRVEGATREQVIKMAKAFRSEITNVRNVRGYLASSQQLYQWMVAPLEAELQARGMQNLIFMMDAGLRSLPMAALHDGQKFLIEKYSIGTMPSLSLTDTRYVDIKNSQVLAMGASEFAELNPLPGVPVELSIITEKLWKGKSFLNEKFTLDNLKAQRRLVPYGIVHLATHGEFKPGSVENSYIQLWDTKLRLNQLRQLGWNDPPVELLVLSACRTALGDEQAELGFAGLAVLAGAKSAVASLWYVSDEGTQGLMADFYAQLKKAPIKAEALRQAQVAMLKGQVRLEGGQLFLPTGNLPLPPELAKLGNQELTHPYYWAAFTMIGNPW